LRSMERTLSPTETEALPKPVMDLSIKLLCVKVSELVNKKSLRKRRDLYGWVSKYWETNFPSQY
jgi:hypothetical protein